MLAEPEDDWRADPGTRARKRHGRAWATMPAWRYERAGLQAQAPRRIVDATGGNGLIRGRIAVRGWDYLIARLTMGNGHGQYRQARNARARFPRGGVTRRIPFGFSRCELFA